MPKRKRGSKKSTPRKKNKITDAISSAAKLGGAAYYGVTQGPFMALEGYHKGKLAGKVAKKAFKVATNLVTKFRNRNATKLHAESTGLIVQNLGWVSMGNPKKKRKLLGTYNYSNVNQWIMTSNQGLQAYDFPEVLFTRSQLVGATSNVRTERYRWQDNPYALNPYYYRHASDVYQNGMPGTGPENIDMLYIKNVRWDLQLLSMEKIPMNVVVYFLTPRYDTDTNPIDAWIKILDAKNHGQIAQNEATTLGTASAVAGYAKVDDIGENPFKHKEFRSMWDTVKTVKIALQAGEQINTRIKIEYEKLVPRIHMLETRKDEFLRGLTIFPLILAYGGMVGLSTAEGTEATEVAFGKTKLGMITNQYITFGALPLDRFSTARTYSGVVERTTAPMRVLDDEDQVTNPEVEV